MFHICVYLRDLGAPSGLNRQDAAIWDFGLRILDSFSAFMSFVL